MDTIRFKGFAIPGSVDLVEGTGGLPKILIRSDSGEAEVYLHGAHVTSFTPKGAKDLLWLSPLSPFASGKNIRGGVPVVFPWFGPHHARKDLPAHGFVRSKSWEIASSARLSDGRVRVALRTHSDEATLAFWPHDFTLELAVTVGAELGLELTATNTGCDPFAYEDCLHTHFAVGAVAASGVSGLEGSCCIDKVADGKRAVRAGEIKPAAALTDVFTLAPPRTVIRDEKNGRSIVCEQEGFRGTVVWTPWTGAETNFPDIGANWKDFLCVEAANCIDYDVTLLPGTSHRSAVRYRLA
ncbi:MAG TPA: D-hexose-6-phosphate mutarotase [Treponema sp.]|nr:MAG: hypothetical protein A2001_21035 [Treponema sp. GWC1_61_84]HCM26092.1 D-hexose-6-phosphate mutarotase [Treponema sp.]